MNTKYNDVINELVEVLQEAGKKESVPLDIQAKVIRVDNDVIWVHLPGGVDETPVRKTINAKQGDVVQVKISNGDAWITGNATAPPTDDTKAITAQNTAQKADEKAIIAQETTDQEIVDRKAIIREYEDGVLVAKQNNNYGALINASGSFDVVQLTWSGKEPIIGSPVARFGSVAKIGDDEKSYMSIDYRSLKFIDGSISPTKTYVHISNLLDEDGNFVEQFIANGITTYFDLSLVALNTDYIVKVNDAEIVSGITKTTTRVTFSSAPNNEDIITVIYALSDSNNTYAYTFGIRKENGKIGRLSFANGLDVIASGYVSHAEGYKTSSSGYGSHAEGEETNASGTVSHAEGYKTLSSGTVSHAEGRETNAYGTGSHAEGGETNAYGRYAHAQNESTHASGNAQTVIGTFNVIDDDFPYPAVHPNGDSQYGKYAFIVGNGTSVLNRSNAYTLDWKGNIVTSGNITADGTVKLSNSIKRKTYTWTISSIGANEYKSTEVSPPSESGYTPVGIIGKGIDGTGTASALWVKCHIRSSDNKLVIGIKNDNTTARTNWTATVYILYVKS